MYVCMCMHIRPVWQNTRRGGSFVCVCACILDQSGRTLVEVVVYVCVCACILDQSGRTLVEVVVYVCVCACILDQSGRTLVEVVVYVCMCMHIRPVWQNTHRGGSVCVYVHAYWTSLAEHS